MAVDKKTPAKTVAKKAPVPAAAAAGPKKGNKAGLPKAALKLLRHRSTRPLWSRIRKTAKAKKVAPASLLKKSPKYVTKPIKGDKNGGTRRVLVKKGRKFYPTEDTIRRKRTGHVCFKNHKRTFKAGIEPGRVVIVLAGRHKGKRIVVLKTLPSGLFLVTGPHVINSCPIRRMHQNFVIVTSTKLDLSSVKFPENLNDAYFKRPKPLDSKKSKSKKGDGGDIFETKVESYKPDAQRKKDQIELDKQIIQVIKKSTDKKLLFAYLGSYFQLRNRIYPHKLKF